MGKPTVWVFYRWMYHTHLNEWIYIVSSKNSFQLNVAQMKKDGHPYNVLAESTDRAMLEQMCELAKEQ